jgi:hypothetical protein
VRFYNVELERRTAAKVLPKDSSQSPRNLASVTVAFCLQSIRGSSSPSVSKGAFVIESDIRD